MRRNLFVLLIATCTQCWSQNLLTRECNLFRDSDAISLQYVSYCCEGDGGQDVVWDFSSVDSEEGSHLVSFSVDSLSRMYRTEDSEIKSYKLYSNILKQYGIENRLQKVRYHKQKLSMSYPLQYGDSLSMPFEGFGRYCGNHDISVQGQVTLQADGIGTLILSDRDTLKNVLRVYTLTTTAMAMDMEFATIDPSSLKQEIEEKYEWYARGYRYPVYTIVQRTSFSNSQAVASSHSAYRLLPENYTISSDKVNESVLFSDSLSCKGLPIEDTFHYSIQDDGTHVIIEYTSDRDVSVSAILASSMGIVYHRQKKQVKAEEPGNICFNYSGLQHGQYVVYINVNGKIYSKTVHL